MQIHPAVSPDSIGEGVLPVAHHNRHLVSSPGDSLTSSGVFAAADNRKEAFQLLFSIFLIFRGSATLQERRQSFEQSLRVPLLDSEVPLTHPPGNY